VVSTAITRLDRLRKELDIAVSGEDFDLAFQVINDMLDIDPENAQFWNSKGVLLAKVDRLEEALVSFDRSLELDPDEPKTWYSKGCVLMDGGEHRLALACLYKSLDLDPEMQKARDRFNKCLDDWVASGDHKSVEDEVETGVEDEEESWSQGSEILITGDEDVIYPTEETTSDDSGTRMNTKDILKRKEESGSFLDDDLFSEDGDEGSGPSEEDEETEEEWAEDDLDRWSEDEVDRSGEEDEEDESDEEEWSEDELEGWDDDAMSETGQEPIPLKTIRCRCGTEIPIYNDERPYRFECPNCSRTGTLKG
jgi:tetratricopeptide (TPR) repeat protein